ncbi:MAG: cation transporter, partial [Sphingobacteriales bacterium]|nr:cation transporter [Sphingobacteriales bacterium]
MRKTELRIILLSVIVSILLCTVKFYTYYLTHSLVILSDALESIINVVAGIFAYYSIYLSGKPRDIDHPYGHGKVEFFSIGFEGAMIFFAGCVIMYEAVKHLLQPQDVKELTTGLYLIIFSAVANLFLGLYLIYAGKKQNSLTLHGNGKHIISDSYTSFGVLAAVILIYFTGKNWIDPVASIVAGLIILISGFKLLSKSVSGLMDATDMETVEDLVIILSKHRR